MTWIQICSYMENKNTPRKRPTQKRSSDLVSSIFEASTRLLKEVGSKKFSTRSVAELAGVSIGSLYQYFPNKEALIGELISREAQRHVEILRAFYEEKKSQPLDIILPKLVEKIFQQVQQDKTFLKIILTAVFTVNKLDSIIAAREEWINLIEDILKDHSPHIKNPRLKSYLIVSSLGGIVETLIFRKEETPKLEDLIRESSVLVESYISA